MAALPMGVTATSSGGGSLTIGAAWAFGVFGFANRLPLEPVLPPGCRTLLVEGEEVFQDRVI
jgi:hypothetical protein